MAIKQETLDLVARDMKMLLISELFKSAVEQNCRFTASGILWNLLEYADEHYFKGEEFRIICHEDSFELIGKLGTCYKWDLIQGFQKFQQ